MILRELNHLTKTEFTEFLATIFEHSPWVASKAAEFRPFASIEELHKSMCEVVRNSQEQEIIDLIRAHPNLGDKLEMSTESTHEQQGVGLQNLSREEYAMFQALNKKYMDTFGFPFVLAVRGKTKNDIREAMEKRVNNSQAIEYETALSEVFKIARFRLEEKIQVEENV